MNVAHMIVKNTEASRAGAAGRHYSHPVDECFSCLTSRLKKCPRKIKVCEEREIYTQFLAGGAKGA